MKNSAELSQPSYLFIFTGTKWSVDNFLPTGSLEFLGGLYNSLGSEYPRRGRTATREGEPGRLKRVHFISTSPGIPLPDLTGAFAQRLALDDVEVLR